MKTFFVITILFIVYTISLFAQDCPPPDPNWYRAVNKSTYKWYWDSNLNGAQFRGYNNQSIAPEDAKKIVVGAIKWAVTLWMSAVNQKGEIIKDMGEASSYYDADFTFTFTALDIGQLGFCPNSTLIQLTNRDSYNWTDIVSVADLGQAYDIYTVILHELGHLFLGPGHGYVNANSIFQHTDGIPFRKLGQCVYKYLSQFYPLYDIIIDNNFTDKYNAHGVVGISGFPYPNLTAPVHIKKEPGQSVTLTAISPQTDNQNYQMIWHSGTTNPSEWRRNGEQFRPDQSITFPISSSDDGATYQAQLRKICSVNFQNRLIGIGNGGLITVNGTSYNSPTSSFSVVELNPITVSAQNGQYFNGITYVFSHWNDNNTDYNRTINPSLSATYSAYYIGYPVTYDPNTGWSMNLHHSTTIGEPIVLYWNEHPNTYVTKYQVWKKEKYNGVTSDPILMATVNRGTTSYVDDGFAYSLLKNKYWIYYTVVPYYSLENTYAVKTWMPVTAEILPKTSDSTFTLTMQYENTLSNYPNPFNPVTNIKYSIKEPGFVNIKVFDLVGQQVAELVNEEKQAGEYSIQFNAASLPSGIYFYTINSGAFTQTRKMLLMK